MSIQGMKARLGRVANGCEQFAMGYFAFVLALTALVSETITEMVFGEHLTERQAANVETIISVVVIAVVAIVGIVIYANVDQSITIEDSELSQSAGELSDGFGDAMELVPVVLIVLVAALLIGVIMRFRAQRQ